jgi:hypothetical protein
VTSPHPDHPLTRRLPALPLWAKLAIPVVLALLGALGVSLVARDAMGEGSAALESVNTTAIPAVRAAGDVGTQANKIVTAAIWTSVT